MAVVENLEIEMGLNIDKVLKSADKLQKTLKYALSGTEGKDLSARLETLRIKADASAKSIENIQKSLKDMESVKVESKAVTNVREEIEDLKRSLEDAKKDLERTKFDVGAGEYDAPLRNKGYSEEQIIAETDKLLANKQATVDSINKELEHQQSLSIKPRCKSLSKKLIRQG